MKKFITFLMILGFAIAGFSQSETIQTEYVKTTTTQFGKYLKAPVFIYLADSTKTYRLKRNYTKFKTMSNVFTDGSAYYEQVSGGATLETEVDVLLDSVADHRTELDATVAETDTNYAGLLQLNARASHTITKLEDLYQIIKYPLMTYATYDFAVDGGGQGTITLYGDTAFLPDNAIIIKVLQDVITAPNSGTSNGTIKFILNTDGDLTLDITADNSTTGLLFGIPGTYALDGGALTAANMGIAEAGTYIKTTALRSVDVTIATADLTAGKIRLYVWYVVSE